MAVAETATPSEPTTVDSSPIVEETAAAADEPDANLVPVETERPCTSSQSLPQRRLAGCQGLKTSSRSLPAAIRRRRGFRTRWTPQPKWPETRLLPAPSQKPGNEVYNVPIVIDSSVQSHIRYFNTSIRNRFEQWLVRLSRYRPLVENIFTEFHLPSDLVYLSLVESGFNPYAYSRAKATGPWQFMKGTAKVYGLRVDAYVDERRDPIKSTVAAARYLRDLYDLFGAWPLAMAAYNAGEGKVMRALQKARSESFTDISKTRLIRRETKEYVPQIHGRDDHRQEPRPLRLSSRTSAPHQFDEVVVTRPLHFHAIANTTGVPYAELRLLNPELRRDATPPGDDAYHLKVPVGTKAKVEQLLDRIPTYKFPPLGQVGICVSRPSRWYKVRMGDTLGKVSSRFRIPLKTLKTRNNLSGPTIRPGDFLVISR